MAPAGKWERNRVWINLCSFARVYPEIKQLAIDTKMFCNLGFEFEQKCRIGGFVFPPSMCCVSMPNSNAITLFGSLTNCSNQKETRTYLNLHKHHSIPHSMTQLWMVGMSKRTNMFAQCSSLVSWTMEFYVVGTNLDATLDNVEFQTWHDQFIVCETVVVLYIASSSAEGGGGSFKNRKPLGEVGCCEWRIAERIHWWTEGWLELCFLEWSQCLQRSPHHNWWM